MTRSGARPVILLLVILALALGLRLYRLDAQSLWNDEGTSVALAQRDLATITRNAANDIHPPLYYYLLHFWVGAAGISEFAVRALSAALGTLVVAATYALTRKLASAKAALLAALIAAVSPFQVYYSQEARMYILAALVGLLLMLAAHDRLTAWTSGVRRFPTWRDGLLVLAGVATLYTHYYGATLLLAVNLGFGAWWALQGRSLERRLSILARWGVLQGVTLAAFAPWLRLVWRTVLGWPSVSAPFTLTELALNLMAVLPLGITVEMTSAAHLVGLGLWVLAGIGAIAVWSRPGRQGRWSAALMVAYLLVPLGLMYVASLRRPMYNPKFILLSTPALHVLQAAGLAALARSRPHAAAWRRILGPALALVLAGGVLTASGCVLQRLYYDPRFARDNYRDAIRYIEAAAGPRGAILINAPSQIETIDYYYDGPLPMIPLAIQRPLQREAAVAELSALVAEHDQLFGIFWATADSDPAGYIESWLAEHTFKTSDRWFGNIRLVVYAVPTEPVPAMAHATDALLGDNIRLAGYTLLTPEPLSGEILQLSLYWETQAPLAKRYTVFAQLLDARQRIVGQRDSEPAGGRRPTDGWQPGETIVDNHGILIRPGAIPGPHTLIVGLYDPATGARLPITDGPYAGGDALILAEVMVAPPLHLPTPEELDMSATHSHAWGSLEIVGHSLARLGLAHQPDAPIRPGDVLEMTLFWLKADAVAPLTAGATAVLLDRSGAVAWQAPIEAIQARYPWEAWRIGEIVRDVHHLTLPADLAPGRYRLALQGDDGRTFALQGLRVVER